MGFPHRPATAPSPRPVRPVGVIALVLLAATLAGCGGGPPAEDAAAPSPQRLDLSGAAAGRHLVLLTVDTVRADRLNAYGYAVRETSPRLDALLASGTLFENANAPRALTWPALTTVLTGLYPSGHGVLENGYDIPDELPTLGERLQEAGYATGAFLSNMCKANHQGWDAFACSGGQDGKTVRRALEWVASVPDAEPIFLWVHLFAAHGPYYNGGDLAARELDPGYEGMLGPKKWRLDRVMLEEGVELTPRDVQHLDALYDAAVIGTDRISGRLLDGLAEAGILGDSVLVFLADHGEELYDHNGYLYHACSVYQSTLHVPLGLVAPGLIPEGLRIPQTVELNDVAPTVLDLMGLEPMPESHGVSLVPYLERGGGSGAGRPAFSEYGATEIHTVLADGWKLVVNPDEIEPFCIADAEPGHYPVEAVELYHLPDDPGETENLAAEEPRKVAELRRLLRRRFAGLSQRLDEQELPEDVREELRALGYVAN